MQNGENKKREVKRCINLVQLDITYCHVAKKEGRMNERYVAVFNYLYFPKIERTTTKFILPCTSDGFHQRVNKH